MKIYAFIKALVFSVVETFRAFLALDNAAYDDESLRSVKLNGKRVRMWQLMKGDIFEINMADKPDDSPKWKRMRALGYPQLVRHPEYPEKSIWAINCVEVTDMEGIHT